MQIRVCRQEEEAQSWEIERQVWNPFNWRARGSVSVAYFPELHLVAEAEGRLLATIDACPCLWQEGEELPEYGWSDIVLEAKKMRTEGLTREELIRSGKKINWACALGTSILPEASGLGLSRLLLEALLAQALSLGYLGVLAPVRPVWRNKMPDISIQDYAQTRRPDGQHFDPWIRTHEKIGGEIIGACTHSAQFIASRDEWEEWSSMKLPLSGKVLIPPSIGWLEISGDKGYLREESVWIKHAARSASDE